MVLVYATAALPRMWVMALVVTEALSDLRVLAAELGRLHGWVVGVLAERWHWVLWHLTMVLVLLAKEPRLPSVL